MIIKTTVDLIEVSNGIPQKIRFNNKLFIPEHLPKTPIIHSPKKRNTSKKRRWSHRNIPEPIDKGKLICTFSGINIFSNVITNVSEAISHPYQNRDIRQLLRKYYPNNKMSSLDTKLYVIIRYIKEHPTSQEKK